MALEDRVLDALGRAPATYYGLRAKLDVINADLDRAVARLEASRQIRREGAIFRLTGPAASSESAPPRVAAASSTPRETAVTQKTCTKCGQSKPLEAFYLNPSMRDGRDSRCRDCKKAQVRESEAKERGTSGASAKVTRTAAPKKPVRETKPPAAATKTPPGATTQALPETPAPFHGQVIFLFAHDGVVIGALDGSTGGVAQLANHIDLTFPQLDALCQVWLERKAGADTR